MKNLLFLKNFNNYYNRRVKKLDILPEYLSYEGVIKDAVNFNPNDGVMTDLMTNWNEEWTPDYMVVFDEYNSIVSRWFVLESKRTRNGQYKIDVRRDVIADSFDSLLEVPMYVKKGNLEASNPLIFNSEGLTYNQIKKNELLLKDETNTPWIVGYLNKSHEHGIDGQTFSVVVDQGAAPELETLGITIKNPSNPAEGAYSYNAPQNINFKLGYTYRLVNAPYIPVYGEYNATYDLANNQMISKYRNSVNGENNLNYGVRNLSDYDKDLDLAIWYSELNKIKSSLSLGFESHANAVGRNYLMLDEQAYLETLVGKIIYSSSTGSFYRLEIQKTETYYTEETLSLNNSYDTSLISALISARQVLDNEGESNDFRIVYSIIRNDYVLIETSGPGEITATIKNGHTTTKDSPYNIFAMPYNEDNMALANVIIEELVGGASGNLYDVQILPYCPARHMIQETGVNLGNGTLDVDYNFIKKETEENTLENVSYILWAKKSSHTFIIPANIPNGTTTEEIKIMNECEFVRLNSPNYSGSFDFNVAKNQGVDYFRVALTYKPFTPYIQVSPNFKGLYGGEFGDARGLICNGDFSVAMINDAWQSYELNNKNFQNIFDTQIKTMDYEHKMGMISQGVASITQAAGVGMGAGMLTGNPMIGAGVGIASAGAGIADLAIGNSIYQSNKQGQIDMFNYNLGNIKARPDTLTKVSAYNVNNKYFPFVEFYSATDKEKEMLLNKLKYEGMTVMTIGKMIDYVGMKPEFNFFKGQIIQSGDIAEDFHFVDTIAVELEKGVYL